MKIELTEMECLRISNVLSIQAMHHMDLAEHYEEKGLLGFVAMEKAEATALMQIKEKLQPRDEK